MKSIDAFDGALLIDKPAGPTSHDIVDAVRGLYGITKVGHCGTLDPQATGLLIMVLGRATRLSERLMADDKVYSGWIKLGESTSSYDADGEVTASAAVPTLDLERLNGVASEFLGDQMQQPPMVSAVKVGGVPLYKLARKGQEVERKSRLIHVYRFRFDDYREPFISFRLACTKGTYVRSLAHDLGQKLGCGAHLVRLRREVSGDFDVKDAIPFEDLARLDDVELRARVIPIPKLLPGGTET